MLLFVSNPQKSSLFYQDIFGIKPVEESPTFVMFALKNGVMLGLWSKYTAEPRAEKIGREQGARFATLNTMDWEALPFYQKLGYSIEFTRVGYDKNSRMFMLKKVL